jgi:DNA-binding NarL/FixJ family response regulator
MSDPAEPTRVFLLDDHEIVRRGVSELLEREDDLAVVGEAGTAAEALARIPSARPDVAVLDIQLGEGSGIEVCREIRASHPDVHCLMLTSYADDAALLESILAGASGHVLKQIRGNDLVRSIRAAAAGESLVDEQTMSRARERLRHQTDEDPLIGTLTNQERKLLALLAEGLTNREIGERMFLAEKTIKNYVSNLLVKMGMKRRTEAAVYAVRHRGTLEDAT